MSQTGTTRRISSLEAAGVKPSPIKTSSPSIRSKMPATIRPTISSKRPVSHGLVKNSPPSPVRRVSTTRSLSRASTPISSGRLTPSHSSAKKSSSIQRMPALPSLSSQKSAELLKELKQLKERNASYQEDLKVKQDAIVEKETELTNLKATFKKLQDDDALIREKLALVESEKQHQMLENREFVEKLREKLEHEKEGLNKLVLEKETQVEKLMKDLEILRQDVQEAHQIYQQRLKSLTDQLTQEHEKAINNLRSEFENKNDALQAKLKEMEISEKSHNQSIRELEEKLRNQVNEITQMYDEKIESLKKEQREEINEMQKFYQTANDSSQEDMEQVYQNRYDNELDKYRQTIESMDRDLRLTLEETACSKQSFEKEKATLIGSYQAQLEKERDAFNKKILEHEAELKKMTECHNNVQRQWEELSVEHNEITIALKSNYTESLTAKERENQELVQLYKVQLEDQAQKSKDSEDELNQQIVLLKEKFDQSIAENLSLQQKNDEILDELNELKNKKETHNLENSKLEKAEREQYMKEIQSLKDQLEFKENEMREEIHTSLTQEFHEQVQQLKSQEQFLKEELLKTKEKLELLTEQNESIVLNQKHSELNGKLNGSEKDINGTQNISLDESAKSEQELRLIIDELKKEKESSCKSVVEMKKSHLFEVNNLKNTISHLHKELETWDTKYTEISKQASDLKREIGDTTFKQAKSNKKENDLKFQEIVRQHQQELNILQNQFQNLLDMKDKEFEELSYRLKTVNGRILRESDGFQDELKSRITPSNVAVGGGRDSKILDLNWIESQAEKEEIQIKNQLFNHQKYDGKNLSLERELRQYKEENGHMLKLIQQLQGEMHQLSH